MRAGWLGLALLLAGCAGASGWSKTGADSAVAAGEYQECRSLADAAVKTEADIDQDIRVTRHSDWQRAAGVRVETQAMQEHTSGRADAIVGACMRAKGFAEPR